MINILPVTTEQQLAAAIEIQLAVFADEQGISEQACMEGNDVASHVIALDKGKPVATARVLVDSDGVAELARIAVLESHRSMGIGKDLVRALESIAAKQGVKQLQLHPHRYLESFYDSLGYAKASEEVDIVGGHELITMCKPIGN